MTELPTYPPLKKPELDAVARSIANENAFAKPAKAATKGVRVRAYVATKRPPGRRRGRKPDRRAVHFY